MGWRLPTWNGKRAGHRRRQSACTAGYTLLEVLLSLSVLGLLLTLALPSFSRLFDELRVSRAAAEVQRALRTAQQLATAHAGQFRRVEARFSRGEGPRVELWGVPWDGLPATPLGSHTLGSDRVTVLRSGASEFTVAFASSGSPLPGHQGTVEVRNGEAVRYVVLAGVTGRVRVSHLRPGD